MFFEVYSLNKSIYSHPIHHACNTQHCPDRICTSNTFPFKKTEFYITLSHICQCQSNIFQPYERKMFRSHWILWLSIFLCREPRSAEILMLWCYCVGRHDSVLHNSWLDGQMPADTRQHIRHKNRLETTLACIVFVNKHQLLWEKVQTKDWFKQ